MTEKTLRISVRNLVEFLLRSGDLDNRRSGRRDAAGQKRVDLIHIFSKIFIRYGVLPMEEKSHGHCQKRQQGSRTGRQNHS